MTESEGSGRHLSARFKGLFSRSRSRSRSPNGDREQRKTAEEPQQEPQLDQKTVAPAVVSTTAAVSTQAEERNPNDLQSSAEVTGAMPSIEVTDDAEPDLAPTTDRSPVVAGFRDLWREAFEELPKITRDQLDGLAGQPLYSTSISEGVDKLVQLAQKKCEKCDQEQWKVEIGGYEIILRDYAVRITSGLALAGDVGAEFAPGPVKAVWPVLKGIMQKPFENYDEQMGALLMCSDKIIRVVNVGRSYEQSYTTSGTSKAVKQLQNDISKMYKATLEIMADAKNLFDKNTCKQTMHAILFPHKTSDLFKNLAQCEATVDRVAQTCGAEALVAMTRGPVARIDQGVEAMLKAQDLDKTVKILDWISSTDHKALHNAASKGRTVGTCQWLLDDEDKFRTWKDVAASSILCIEGSPGTGKTVLTSQVIDYFANGLEQSPQEALAYFYCNRAETGRHDWASILRSLARQLSSHKSPQSKVPLLTKEIVSIYNEAQINGEKTMDENHCSKHLLKHANMYSATTIVLDAFDECDKNSQTKLASIFNRLVKKCNRPVKIFISSRPNDVQNFTWTRISVEGKGNKADIERYISGRIRGEEKKKNEKDDEDEEDEEIEVIPQIVKDMQDEIQKKLLEKCGSMFKWVELQLNMLFSCSSEEAIRHRLEHMPTGLFETYDEIYKTIQGLDDYDRRRADRAIMWVMCTREPLGKDQLLDLIRIGTEDAKPLSRIDEKSVLSLCDDLLVLNPKRDVWGFPHSSVLEYFEQQPMSSGRPNRQRAEACVATTCLRLLNDHPGDPLSQTAFDESKTLKDYADEFWVSHVESVEQSSDEFASRSVTASVLRTFLGSPSDGSQQYIKWHKEMAKLKKRISMSSASLWELRPATTPIVTVARLGLFGLLRDWWDTDGLPKNTVNEEGYNLLSLAAISGCVAACRHLLARGYKPDDIDNTPVNDGECGSALAAAAHAGHLDIVKVLVEEGGATVGLSLKSGWFGSALAAAAKGHCVQVVEYLIKKDPNSVNCVLRHGSYGSALIAAALNSAGYDAIAALLRAGADPDLVPVVGEYGSALAAAVDNRALGAAKLLIAHNADVNHPLVYGQYGSALAAAVRWEWMVQFLVENGAQVNQVLTSGYFPSALFAALSFGSKESFFYLVSQGANISAIIESDIPVQAIAASMADHYNTLSDLAEDGTINDRERVIQEGILIPRVADALLESENDVVRALVRAGADVNAMYREKGGFYGSCLELVAFGGRIEQMDLLFDECHANPNLASISGHFGCALTAAVCEDEEEAVQHLLDKGADPNLQLSRQDVFTTPLIAAAFTGRYECAKCLLRGGAIADLRVDGSGTIFTALEAAEQSIEHPVGEKSPDEWWNVDARLWDEIEKDRARIAELLQRWFDDPQDRGAR